MNIRMGIGNLTMTTGMISENSFGDLIESVEPIKEEYRLMAKKIDPNIKGLKVRYYQLDADDYGGELDIGGKQEWVSAEVEAWLIEIEPLYQEDDIEIIETD